ncbi:hypothetical protein PROFUN_16588 [Planoprotostelium fungivorum]|uniref:Uncharacterized protein n=1 Tax=Planoprotostelium fungivorum TaxID=1890364 RepID=A0A2P6MNR0_9EUKA|nr:hypothetical protein PROFUN_16588 [Planoprotostelium fungivorum]
MTRLKLMNNTNLAFSASENSATKKHIQCTFIEKEYLGFLWFEIILYKQRLIELFGSYVDLQDKFTPLQFDALHHVSCLSCSVSLDNYPLFVGRDAVRHQQDTLPRGALLSYLLSDIRPSPQEITDTPNNCPNYNGRSFPEFPTLKKHALFTETFHWLSP